MNVPRVMQVAHMPFISVSFLPRPVGALLQKCTALNSLLLGVSCCYSHCLPLGSKGGTGRVSTYILTSTSFSKNSTQPLVGQMLLGRMGEVSDLLFTWPTSDAMWCQVCTFQKRIQQLRKLRGKEFWNDM